MHEVLRRNLGYKLAAIFLAILLWMYVTLAQNPMVEKTFPVEVSYNSLAPNYILAQKPQQIDVKVRGQRAIINSINATEIKAEVNLANAKLGENKYNIKTQGPTGVEIVNVNPNRLSLVIDKITERQLPIVANIRGQVSIGYSNFDPIFSPSQVVVKGPKERLDNLKEAQVDISLENADENLILNLPVKVLDKWGNILGSGEVILNPATVEVTIPIIKNSPTKTVPIKINLNGKPKEGWQISRLIIVPETIKITGPFEKLDQIEAISTQPIDIEGIDNEKIVFTELSVPQGISVLYQSGIKVVIQVEKSPVTKTFTDLPIKIINLSPELTPVFEPKSVAVTIQGTNEEIARINGLQIIPLLDMLDLNIGVQKIPVQVDLPEGLQVIKIDPNQIEVKLEEDTQKKPNEAKIVEPKA